MFNQALLQTLVVLAGVGQLLLALASLAIPKQLGWKDDTASLQPLTREVFWTYACYIWGTNVAMGLVSVLRPTWLLDGSGLAVAVCGYITLYWSARVTLQLFGFGKHAPKGLKFKLAEGALLALFSYLAVVYGLAFSLGF